MSYLFMFYVDLFFIFSLISIARRDQVNLLVYGPDRPYFQQKQKNDFTEFWPTGIFLNLLFSAF